MRIDIITVLPELLDSPFAHSILKRGQQKGIIEVNVIPLREFATNKYKSVDDYSFGGAAGMVMMCEPIANWIDHLKLQRNYDEVIYLTPDGELFSPQSRSAMAAKMTVNRRE